MATCCRLLQDGDIEVKKKIKKNHSRLMSCGAWCILGSKRTKLAKGCAS